MSDEKTFLCPCGDSLGFHDSLGIHGTHIHKEFEHFLSEIASLRQQLSTTLSAIESAVLTILAATLAGAKEGL